MNFIVEKKLLVWCDYFNTELCKYALFKTAFLISLNQTKPYY